MQCYINRSVHYGGESVRSTRQTQDFLSASYFCVIFISTFLIHVNFVAIIVYLQTTVVEGKKRTETEQQRRKMQEAAFPSIPPVSSVYKFSPLRLQQRVLGRADDDILLFQH